MKTQNRYTLLFLALTGFIAIPALAATSPASTDLIVSATVQGACKFNSSGTITFNLDPSVGGDITATATPQPSFSCTKGTAYTISHDDGVQALGPSMPQMKDASNNLLPYQIVTFTHNGTGTGTGMGAGQEVLMTIDAKVLFTDYQNAAASNSYNDTVKLFVNF